MAGDKVVLEEVLKQQKQERAPTLSPDKFFEVFCVDQILKDFDLTYDNINSGIFDGANDGGIDWAYLFVNRVVVNVDEEIALPPKGDLEFLLVVGQSKNEDTFKETPIDRLRSRLEILLKLDPDVKDLAAVKPELNDFFSKFRELYLKAAARFPRLEIRLYYACKGIKPETGSKPDALTGATIALLVDRFGKATPVSFELLGSRELLELARERPTESFTLRLSESPVSSSRVPGYIGLVRLVDFYSFLVDGKGQLRQRLFEANVRDYQGTRGSNVEIKASLEEKPAADFWWLNNGVTIIASDAKEAARNLAIQNPYIVNGLQTSNEIFRYFSGGGDKNDDRNVLVRVIVTQDSEIADKIIRATNSQIYIPPAQLKATEKIHRDIEDFMKKYDLYYDRRKNHYKMQGKPISRIVGILELAQAVMAAALGRPADARARPSTVLNNESDYDQLFNENTQLLFIRKPRFF
jgi:AIPR protein